VVRLSAAAEYIAANHERLGLDRFGIPARPSSIVLTPRFRRSRHIVVLVLAPGRREPVLVAKLPRLAGDGDGLAAEAGNLMVVGRMLAEDDRGTLPTVLAFESGGDYPLLLETALAGSPLSPRALRRDRETIVQKAAGWLGRLASATAAAPPDKAWYERLIGAPLRRLADDRARPAGVREMAMRTLAVSEVLRDSELPLVCTHGDFGHPNLLCQADGRLGVLDWERAEPAGLPGDDLFFFLAYAAQRDGRAPFFGRRPWAWRIAEDYAERVGIDRRLLRPLVAVSCARALDAGAAAARMTPLWHGALAG